MNPWDLNPAWYFLVSLAVSFVALYFSIWSFRFARRAKRSEIVQGLIRQAVEINESFARHGIKGPYALRLGIPNDKVPTFATKGAVFLNHINLLRGVYDTRHLLGKPTENAYLKWVSTVVNPWVEADSELREIWKFFEESEDLVGGDFVQWLSPHLRIEEQVIEGRSPV